MLVSTPLHITYNEPMDVDSINKDLNNNHNDCIDNPTNRYTYIKPFSPSTVISNIDDEKYDSNNLKGPKSNNESIHSSVLYNLGAASIRERLAGKNFYYLLSFLLNSLNLIINALK